VWITGQTVLDVYCVVIAGYVRTADVDTVSIISIRYVHVPCYFTENVAKRWHFFLADLLHIPCCNQAIHVIGINIYTMNHKKHATFFLIITLAFLGRFLYFLHLWKQEGILYKQVNKIYHFTLTVSSHYLVKLKPRINSTF